MRITRLYHPENLVCGATTLLDTNNSNHLVRVLRTKVNADIVLFNGDGFNYLCKTLDTNSKHTHVAVESRLEANNESNLNITLLQGLSRHDRMDQCIQKSVELGVNKIIPVLCQRSNTKLNGDKLAKKSQHWKKIVISACEQSGRSVIPKVTEVTSIINIDQFLNKGACKVILNPTSDLSLSDLKVKPNSAEVFIGPEGGLNNDEISTLESSGFKSINFGPRILRTETTGPAVISALQVLWGDF